MKRTRTNLVSSIIAVCLAAGFAGADVHLKDVEPPFYLSGGGPFLLDEDTLFAIHDGEWAAIPFYRDPLFAPDGFDLLHDFDPNFALAPLHVKGDIHLTDDGDLRMAKARGTGAVPVWFVRWDELQELTADGDLTVDELLDSDSLLIGTATAYREENHVAGVHPVSHLTYVASGTLEDGRSFDLRAVEVGLELKQVNIDFED